MHSNRATKGRLLRRVAQLEEQQLHRWNPWEAIVAGNCSNINFTLLFDNRVVPCSDATEKLRKLSSRMITPVQPAAFAASVAWHHALSAPRGTHRKSSGEAANNSTYLECMGSHLHANSMKVRPQRFSKAGVCLMHDAARPKLRMKIAKPGLLNIAPIRCTFQANICSKVMARAHEFTRVWCCPQNARHCARAINDLPLMAMSALPRLCLLHPTTAHSLAGTFQGATDECRKQRVCLSETLLLHTWQQPVTRVPGRGKCEEALFR